MDSEPVYKRPKIEDFWDKGVTLQEVADTYESQPQLFNYVQALDNYIDYLEEIKPVPVAESNILSGHESLPQGITTNKVEVPVPVPVQEDYNILEYKLSECVKDSISLHNQITDYKHLLETFTDCPKLIIDNPQLVKGTLPTDADNEWAQKQIKKYEAEIKP